MRVSLLFLSLLMLPAVSALIIDEAAVLDSALESTLEEFNTRSAVTLSIITTPSTYGIVEQAAENFNTYQLKLLLFYSKTEDQAVIVQPPGEGIPEAEIAQLLQRYRPINGKLDPIIIELMANIGQWQTLTYGEQHACALFKDGRCDTACGGIDLDCLCGNAVCEHFETPDTCPRDCKQHTGIWCGIQRDNRCDAKCAIRDIDCTVKPEIVARNQRAAFTIGAVLGGILLIMASVLQLFRRMRRKGASFNMVDWLIKLALLFGAVSAVLFLLQHYLNIEADTRELRSEIFLQRLLNSPSGIAYVDTNGVAWPGTIDFQKFNERQLNASMTMGGYDWVAAELELAGKRIWFNRIQYEQWQHMVVAGSAMSSQRELPVLIHNGAQEERGVLRVSIITPRD